MKLFVIKHSKLRYLLLLLTCLLIFPAPLKAGPSVNKRFVYYIYWSGIKAGETVLDYISTPDGTTIRTHATSAPIVSLFYPVDDIAESTLYPDGYPKRFIVKVRKGRYKTDKITSFERKAEGKPQKIVYFNSRKDETEEFFLDKQAYDPLSAFYEMTKWDLKIGQTVFIDIFDSKKLWNTEVKVLRKERVEVPAGEFNTIVVKPILKSEGIFPKTGDITIWATDDDRKLPVLLKSKAIIGYFSAELVESQ